MSKIIKIRDLSLREGRIAGSLSDNDLASLLPLYAEAGLYAADIWGGTLPESLLKSGQDPWSRIDIVAQSLKGNTVLASSSKGRNLFGKSPLPNYLQTNVRAKQIQHGIELFRLTDPLNDLDNLHDSIKLIADFGGRADINILFATDEARKEVTVAPKRGFWNRLFATEQRLPEYKDLFSDQYFVDKARKAADLGASEITLSDLTGLCSPERVFSLMPKLKHAVKIPVGFHAASGIARGLASTLTAIIKGADIIDVNIWSMTSTYSAPPLELIAIFCNRLDIRLGADMNAIAKIRSVYQSLTRDIEGSLGAGRPLDFETALTSMPTSIDAEFDKAIFAAGDNNQNDLLESCRKIEEYFGFYSSDTPADYKGRPLRMIENMERSLAKVKAEDLLEEAVDIISNVRKDAGMPPLHPDIAKIIGDQAVRIALDRRKEASDYTSINDSFIYLISGIAGKTPAEISSAFREKITGSPDERVYDPASYKEPEIPEIEEFGNVKLARTDEEKLLLEIFPDAASQYLRELRRSEFQGDITENDIVSSEEDRKISDSQ